MTSHRIPQKPQPVRLLTVPQAADRLNVGERFIRRLIEERRITFVKVGRHVRIPDNELESYVANATVPAMARHGWPSRAVA